MRRVDVAGDAVGESHLAAGGGLIIMLSGQSSFNYYTRWPPSSRRVITWIGTESGPPTAPREIQPVCKWSAVQRFSNSICVHASRVVARQALENTVSFTVADCFRLNFMARESEKGSRVFAEVDIWPWQELFTAYLFVYLLYLEEFLGIFLFLFFNFEKKFILGIEDLFEPIKVGRFCLLFKQPIFIFIRLKDLHHRKTVKPWIPFGKRKNERWNWKVVGANIF